MKRDVRAPGRSLSAVLIIQHRNHQRPIATTTASHQRQACMTISSLSLSLEARLRDCRPAKNRLGSFLNLNKSALVSDRDGERLKKTTPSCVGKPRRVGERKALLLIPRRCCHHTHGRSVGGLHNATSQVSWPGLFES